MSPQDKSPFSSPDFWFSVVAVTTIEAANEIHAIAGRLGSISTVLDLPPQEVQEKLLEEGDADAIAEHPGLALYRDLRVLSDSKLPEVSEELREIVNRYPIPKGQEVPKLRRECQSSVVVMESVQDHLSRLIRRLPQGETRDIAREVTEYAIPEVLYALGAVIDEEDNGEVGGEAKREPIQTDLRQ